MAEKSQRAPLPPPPPLPARLVAPSPVILGGTVVWFVVLCALLVARLGFDAGRPLWLWTALAGWLLGFLGYSIYRWQRAAAGRGSRGAQQGFRTS